MNTTLKVCALTAFLGSSAMIAVQTTVAKNAQEVSKESVLNHYADLALYKYSDSLETAKQLKTALQTMVGTPTTTNHEKAKLTWKAARVPYQQTEVYRFGNAIVDDWEGKVNAWPLDEGLIDYVAPSYGAESEDNLLYTANVIANPRFKLSGQDVDASKISKTFLSETLHEIDGVEANVCGAKI